jgi:acyl-coenzyme A synthetase/AMP-(fatty) acid ligase
VLPVTKTTTSLTSPLPSAARTMLYEERVAEFRWQIPEEFNFAADVIDAYAEDRSRLALVWENEAGEVARYTFWDFSEQSRRFANILRSLGVRAGDPVMIMLPRIPEWQVTFLGVIRIGALAIPCTAQLRAKDIVYRANHSEATAIVTAEENCELVESALADCPSLRVRIVAGGPRPGWTDFRQAMRDAPRSLDRVPTRSSDPAICFYTSGTTKEPKAVLHAHSYMLAHRVTGEAWLDLRRADLHWTTSDTGWAKAAWGVLFGPWNLGVPVLMYNGRFDPKKELQILEKHQVTTFCAPPTEYRMLVKEDLGRFDLSKLRHCTGAGEPLNPEVIEQWKKAFGLTIHDGYGQSETVLLIGNLAGLPVRPGSMGKPAPGHDVRIIDEAGNEVPAGEVGEIALRGRTPSLFLEYWKNPAESAACWRGQYYLTGDRAYRDEQGYFWFVGRGDDVIISAGYRIGPFEVESALLTHPAVLESAVVASPDPIRGSIAKAFIKLRSQHVGSEDLRQQLQDHVKRVTAPYKYPREIEFVDDLPKTVSGKIRRVELRKREEERKRSGIAAT